MFLFVVVQCFFSRCGDRIKIRIYDTLFRYLHTQPQSSSVSNASTALSNLSDASRFPDEENGV